MAGVAVKLQPTNKQFAAARTEFKELSIGELKEFEKMFSKFDKDNSGSLDLMELKMMMEDLKLPQTHLGLKAILAELDEDNDGVISYREFLLIFRKAKTGKWENAALNHIAQSVKVADVGAKGAAAHFENIVASQNNDVAEKDKAYREEIKKKNAEKAVSKANFKDKMSNFQ